jgi:hypothetical protein
MYLFCLLLNTHHAASTWSSWSTLFHLCEYHESTQRRETKKRDESNCSLHRRLLLTIVLGTQAKKHQDKWQSTCGCHLSWKYFDTNNWHTIRKYGEGECHFCWAIEDLDYPRARTWISDTPSHMYQLNEYLQLGCKVRGMVWLHCKTDESHVPHKFTKM